MIKINLQEWREGLVVRSSEEHLLSYRGSEFGFLCPHDASQLFLTPAPVDLTPSCLQELCMHMVHLDTFRQGMYINKTRNNSLF